MTSDSPIAAPSLTPSARVRADLAAMSGAVAATTLPVFDAVGAALAEDLVAPAAVPPSPVALIAGHAVASVETVGASPYAPAMPSRTAPVAAGDPLPAGTDAVLPTEAVVFDFGLAMVQQAVAPGENTRRAGEDFAAGTIIARAATRLMPQAALLAAAIGLDTVAVRRPRVVVGHGGSPESLRAARFLAARSAGGPATVAVLPLDAAVAAEADLTILVGGAEIGPGDPAAALLAPRLGAGIALRPGESLAWGGIAGHPALVLPSRPEAVLAAAVALIDPLVAVLAGLAPASLDETRPLARKLVSQVGMSEIALLGDTADGGGWEPLATGDLTWNALARARAWVELPPESEGIAEGTPLRAHRL